MSRVQSVAQVSGANRMELCWLVIHLHSGAVILVKVVCKSFDFSVELRVSSACIGVLLPRLLEGVTLLLP